MIPGIALIASAGVDRIIEWQWNAREERRMHTCRGSSSGEGNTDGGSEKSLVDASAAHLDVANEYWTHESGNKNGCKQYSIVVPKRACS